MSKVTFYGAMLATVVGVLLSCEQAEARILARSAAPAIDCCPPACPTPCITYRHHGHRKACCNALPPIETVLCVKNPTTCCEVYVPVCIPACCSDCPKVTSRCGVLGRGVVTYQYPSGFTIRMVFNRHGDLTVHYHGNY